MLYVVVFLKVAVFGPEKGFFQTYFDVSMDPTLFVISHCRATSKNHAFNP